MNSLEGNYFDGQHPLAVSARLEFWGIEVFLTAGSVSGRYETLNLIVSPRIGSASRFIRLPDGGQFVCDDDEFLDSLTQESGSEGPVAWLEDHWGVALGCVVFLFITLGFGYFIGLPVAAERIVTHIPMESERSLGEEALLWLENEEVLKPSKVPKLRRLCLWAGFSHLHNDLPFKEYYRLEFRDSPSLGANAFAFPGGIIVITDELIELADTNEEVLAILAHEIGHVEHRHSLRNLFQDSVIGVVVATITSDAATLTAVVAGLPMLVARNNYSRDFETVADDFAFALLKRKGYSPDSFATVMKRLKDSRGDDSDPVEWISTHPDTSERIKRAGAEAKELSRNQKK